MNNKDLHRKKGSLSFRGNPEHGTPSARFFQYFTLFAPPGFVSLVLLSFVFFLLPVRQAFSEEGGPTEKKDPNVFYMGELVVTSKGATASKVATVTEVTREDFLLRGVNTAADALRYIPGGKVSFSRGSLEGNGKNEDLLRLRGFETTDILVLIDGMPLTEPYMKRVDLSQVPLDNVAKIKVVKGPSSVLYGPNSAGGIVNIVTERGETGFRSFLDQRFGDYKSFRTLAQNQGAKGPFTYVLGGSYDRSDGFPVSRDFPGSFNQEGTLRANSDYERYNLAGRFGTDVGTQGSVSVGGGYYSYGGGVPFGMSDLDPTLWRKEWDRWYINGLGEWNFTDELGVKAQLFYNNFNNKIKDYTDTTFQRISSDGKGISTHDNVLYGFFVNPWWDLGRVSSLKAGIRYDKEQAKIQDEVEAPWEQYVNEIYALALEDEVRPFDTLSLVAGVGYSYYRKIEAFNGDVLLDLGDDIDTVDFQFGAFYTPCPWVKLHASAGRKTSFPTLRQLYSPDGGNRNLKAQTALTYEVGVEGTYKKGYPGASLALFRSDVDDLIVKKELSPGEIQDPTLQTDYQLQNVDEALLQGLELSINWHPLPLDGLGLYANYTFLHAEDKNTGKALDFRPPHVFNLEARYQSSFGLTAGAVFSYTSAQKYVPKGLPDQIEELPASGLWEIYLAQKFPFEIFPERYVELYVDVENLLDEYYEQDPRKAAPGRTVWAGIRASF